MHQLVSHNVRSFALGTVIKYVWICSELWTISSCACWYNAFCQ